MKKHKKFGGLTLIGLALLVLFSFNSCNQPIGNTANNTTHNTENSGSGSSSGSGSGTGSGTTVQTDKEILDAAKKNLEIHFENSETYAKVLSTFGLKEKGTNGVCISWKSNNETCIKIENGTINGKSSLTGKVTRPENNTEVTLTATLTKGSETTTKEFKITVYGKKNEILDILNKVKKILTIEFENNESNSKVLTNFNLNKTTHKGVSLSWKSNNNAIKIKEYSNKFTGEITRPEEDTVVTLTATLTKGSESTTKTFTITVYGKNNESVDNAYQSTNANPLLIQDLSAVSNITLTPSQGTDANGVNTTWTSDNTNIISNVGAVTRPSEKTEVKLTASIKKGTVERKKEFTVTVFPNGTNANDAELLDMITLPTETLSYFALPASISGSTKPITWKTSNDKIIEIDENDFGFTGKFAKIKPAIFTDQKATLTATIDSTSKDFEVTVKGIKEYDFHDGRKITFTENEIMTYWAIYRYSEHDKTNKSFKSKIIKAKAEEGGEFTDPEIALQKELKMENKYLEILYNTYKKLAISPTISLQNIKEILLNPLHDIYGVSLPTSNEDIFKYLQRDFQLNFSMDFSEFKTKSPTEKTKIIKKALEEKRKQDALEYELNESSTWDAILIKVKELNTKWLKNFLEQETLAKSYIYSVTFSHDGSEIERIHSYSLYQGGVKWHKQRGSYNDSTNNISLSQRGTNQWYLEFPYEVYKCTFNEDFTKLTGVNMKDSSDKITATVTDNNDGTITISINGGASYTLTFEGQGIF